MSQKAVMLYSGDSPHPAHQGFAKKIGANLYGLDSGSLKSLVGTPIGEIYNGFSVEDYDVYIAEGTRALYGALVSQIARDAILIYLAADQALYKLVNRNDDDRPLTNRLIGNYGFFALKWCFNHFIDGVITISKFSEGYTSDVVSLPIKIAHPYVQSEIYDALQETEPTMDRNIAVTVGSYSWYKGQEILPTVWEQVRQDCSDAELYLVGSGYPEYFGEMPGVTLCGYVDDLADVLSQASLYVHPARAEAFGVSVVEALVAGLPAIVTKTTGSKSVIGSVDESMIVDRAVESIADAIVRYFNQPINERKEISKRAQIMGAKFDPQTRKQAFKNEFEMLLRELEQHPTK